MQRLVPIKDVYRLLYFVGAFAMTAWAQGGPRGFTAHNPVNDGKPYDKHELSGIWSRNGTPGGYGGGGTCRDCGDRGFSNNVPPFTPLGQKMFDEQTLLRTAAE